MPFGSWTWVMPGVDIIRDEHGRYFVLEINSIPAWKGLQGVTETSIADCLVADFLAQATLPVGQRSARAMMAPLRR